MTEVRADTVMTEESSITAEETAVTETTPAPEHPFLERIRAKVQELHLEINAFINTEEGKAVHELHQAKLYLGSAVDSVKKHLIG